LLFHLVTVCDCHTE